MPLNCADLPYQLAGDGYSFEYENPGDGGRLWVYNTGNVDFGGKEGQQIGQAITVHVSAHVDADPFSTVHLTPDYGPWQRFHVRYVNGARQAPQGREYCRDQAQLDRWWNEMSSTLDACAAAFWNATEARAAIIATQAGAGRPKVQPDQEPDTNDAFDATYEMEHSGRFVDTSEPDPDAISIADMTSIGGENPWLPTDDGRQVIGRYLDDNHVLFPGPFPLNGMFWGTGLVFTVDQSEPPRVAQLGE
jgi:hypothetical protein